MFPNYKTTTLPLEKRQATIEVFFTPEAMKHVNIRTMAEARLDAAVVRLTAHITCLQTEKITTERVPLKWRDHLLHSLDPIFRWRMPKYRSITTTITNNWPVDLALDTRPAQLLLRLEDMGEL